MWNDPEMCAEDRYVSSKATAASLMKRLSNSIQLKQQTISTLVNVHKHWKSVVVS